MTERPHLRALGDHCGILAGYESVDGRWRETSDATREALLAAMGCDAGSEESAARELQRIAAGAADPPANDEATPCMPAAELIGERRLYGIAVNLYSVRSDRNWGIGDLTDLRQLVGAAASAGAAFIAVNPLQAMAGAGNPYYPSSRLYLDPVYLDVEAVPELRNCSAAQQIIASPAWRARCAAARAADSLDWPALAAAKDEVLRLVFAGFDAVAGSRRVEFDSYCRSGGTALRDFATYCALSTHQGGIADWRVWPAPLRSPASAEVDAFRRERRAEIEYFAYLQFELDRQVAEVAAAARAAAMPIGLFSDLPVGCAPGGSDTWAHSDMFAAGVAVGAPPDAYATAGQNWGLAALRPQALTGAGSGGYWPRLLRAAMCHSGALRLDHAMGVERQFWIPDGQEPANGAYVAYPTSRIVADIGAASRENCCIVVAEDLGTVPRNFRARLKRWGILRNQILYFERSSDQFHGVDGYDLDALVAANTHDLAPLAGYWRGTDLELRRRAGLSGDREFAVAAAEREREKQQLVELLRATNAVAPEWRPERPRELVEAAYSFLAATRSRLLSVALDDLGGEREPINLPGAPPGAHVSWVRRMRLPHADILADPMVQRSLARISEIRNCQP